jgi:hypothetical protein
MLRYFYIVYSGRYRNRYHVAKERNESRGEIHWDMNALNYHNNKITLCAFASAGVDHETNLYFR